MKQLTRLTAFLLLISGIAISICPPVRSEGIEGDKETGRQGNKETGNKKPTPNPQSPIRTSTGSPEGHNPQSSMEIVHSQRLESGVPLGGIGAGTFQVLTDGTVSRATVANNWDRPTGEAPGCFAAIWERADGHSVAHVLALHSAYLLPTAAKLDYDGLYPQALLTYPDAALPVSVTLLAFSPLVPFDLKNSSFPAAAYIARLKNPGVTDVEVSVALSWESLLAPIGATNGKAAIIPSRDGFFGARFVGSDPDGEMTVMAYPPRAQAAVTTALWDASTAHPAWWESFAREGTVPDAPPTAMETGTRSAAVIAVRLTLKPGESVEVPFAVSWYENRLRTPAGEDVGHYYQNAFADAQDAARQLLEDWRSLYGLTEEWQKRLTFSNLPRWQARRLINAAAPLTANTIHTRDGRFAFLGTVGNGAASPGSQGGEGAKTSGTGLSAVQSEREETMAHQSADALLLALFPQLAAQELAQFGDMQDSEGFVVPPADADWPRRLGPAKPPRLPLIPNPPSLFAPAKTGKDSKASSTRNGKANGKKGVVTPLSPTSAQQPLVTSKPSDTSAKPSSRTTSVPELSLPLPPASPALDPLDATSAYVLEATQLTLWTGDPEFLTQNYSHLRRALHALLTLRDRDGLPTTGRTEDGRRKTEGNAIVNPQSTIHNRQSTISPPPASLTLWLAALRAGEKMAVLAGENSLAQECGKAATQGSAALEARHWNGEFYAEEDIRQARAGGVSARMPNARCATDQLWGQWIAYQLDLGPLLPPAHLARAALSLMQRNDLPRADLIFPPWQIRVDGKLPDDPTSADCLLPAALLSDAALHFWQDQPETGMALLRRLEDARDNIAHSPWQYSARLAEGKTEDGRRKTEEKKRKAEGKTEEEPQSKIQNPKSKTVSSLAVAADWNLLYALQGFALDLNRGQMTLAPNIPGDWRGFIAPIFAPTFWGRMEYRPTVHGGITTFRLDRLIGFVTSPATQALRNRAELSLKTLRVSGPPRRQDTAGPAKFTTHVSVGQKPIGCRATQEADGSILLTFDSPLTLTAGDRLEVDVH